MSEGDWLSDMPRWARNCLILLFGVVVFWLFTLGDRAAQAEYKETGEKPSLRP